jgi:hypothetical protein
LGRIKEKQAGEEKRPKPLCAGPGDALRLGTQVPPVGRPASTTTLALPMLFVELPAMIVALVPVKCVAGVPGSAPASHLPSNFRKV